MTFRAQKDKKQELIPQCIDDIIRDHREELVLEIVKDHTSLVFWIPYHVHSIKAELDKAILYKRIMPGILEEAYYLAGLIQDGNRIRTVHSASVISVNIWENTVTTEYGESYIVKEFQYEHVESLLLVTICQQLNEEGLGEYYGVPGFY